MVGHLAASGVPIDVHHHEIAAAGQGEIDMRFDTLARITPEHEGSLSMAR